ncbi:MAG TPA: acyl-CoA dehydrogenase family protein [Myxococcota bacterium]|nr:acyl-CoA dehydrogenase family protein [Myxococcota bacterium]
MAEVRRTMETPEGFDDALWKRMARELGLQGVHLPEAYGGQGFSFLELGIVQEELGRALVPTPYFSTVCLAANAILNAGSEADRRLLLPAIASGEPCLAGELGRLGPSQRVPRVSPRRELRSRRGEDARFRRRLGRASSRGGAPSGDPRGRRGVTLLRVDRAAPGVKLDVPPSLDPTRRQARLELAGARAEALGRRWSCRRRAPKIALPGHRVPRLRDDGRCSALPRDGRGLRKNARPVRAADRRISGREAQVRGGAA